MEVPGRIIRKSAAAAAMLGLACLSGCAPQLGREVVREQNAKADLALYETRAPEIDAPVTLADALELAQRHNIDVWIAAEEQQYQHELATGARLKLLPSLVAGTEASHRSEFDAARSVAIESGEESLEPSYSAEKTRRTFDVGLTWNLLDFGISYMRSRQAANREQIAEQRLRRVRQNLALEVTRVYWQAVTAREAAAEADRIAAQLADRLAGIDAEIEAQNLSRVEGLTRKATLLEQQEELRRYRRAYLAAKTELAALMGLAPGTPFLLADVDVDQDVTPRAFSIDELEWAALRQRPELYEKDFEQAISRDEAHVALVEMFPHVSLFWQANWDDNRLLVFKEWNTIGLRATWDLLMIPQKYQQRQALLLQTDLIARRRTAIAVAVLTQLRLALIEHDEAAEQLALARRIAATRRELLAAIESSATEGSTPAGAAFEERMRYLKARARELRALASFKAAQARVLNTAGERPSCPQAEMTRGELLQYMVHMLERRAQAAAVRAELARAAGNESDP